MIPAPWTQTSNYGAGVAGGPQESSAKWKAVRELEATHTAQGRMVV